MSHCGDQLPRQEGERLRELWMKCQEEALMMARAPVLRGKEDRGQQSTEDSVRAQAHVCLSCGAGRGLRLEWPREAGP